MEYYHEVWLSVHLNRTKEWLQEKLSDGFSIHHTDGVHANNVPNNLVLIETSDHMLLHGRDGFAKSLRRPRQKKEKVVKPVKIKAIKSANSKIGCFETLVFADGTQVLVYK